MVPYPSMKEELDEKRAEYEQEKKERRRARTSSRHSTGPGCPLRVAPAFWWLAAFTKQGSGTREILRALSLRSTICGVQKPFRSNQRLETHR